MLGLLAISFLVISCLFSGISQDDDHSVIWVLLFSVLTLTTITAFHKLGNDNHYKKFFQILVCTLVLSSLIYLIFLIFSVLKNGDGNLLVNSVLLISTVVNFILLFYLIQDKKYNHNG